MKRIADLRARNGWSQKDLASKIGAHPAAVSRWELGMSEPNIKALVALSEVLNVSIDYLCENTDEPARYAPNAGQAIYSVVGPDGVTVANLKAAELNRLSYLLSTYGEALLGGEVLA